MTCVKVKSKDVPLSVLRNIQKFRPGEACPGRWQDKAAGDTQSAVCTEGQGYLTGVRIRAHHPGDHRAGLAHLSYFIFHAITKYLRLGNQ